MKTTVATTFTKFNTNKKNETIIELTVRGDLSDEQIVALHKLKAAGEGFVSLCSSQASIEEYEPPKVHEGITGKLDKDGVVTIDPGQLTIDQLGQGEPTGDDLPDFNAAPPTDEEKPARARRTTKKEKEEAAAQSQQEENDEDLPPLPEEDDSL